MTRRKALSSYWASAHHRALGGASDAARLAIAIGAVKSIVRVVDRHMPPLVVQWAQVNPDEKAPVRSMSYTDLTGGVININPMPIMDPGTGNAEALDVVTGFGLHEAGHSQESRDRYKHLLKRVPVEESTSVDGPILKGNLREVPAFAPMAVASYLWNLVEDVRMEAATAAKWPGFAAYFDAILDWMWSDMRSRHVLPTMYGPTIADKLRVVFLACRFPGRLPSSMTRPSKKNDMASEITWWQGWQADYLSDAVDTPTTIQRGLDHLREDVAGRKELDEMAAKEQRERELGEKLRAQLDRLMREGIDGTFEVCITENGEIKPLDQETADEVRKLVRENLIEVKTVIRTVGAANVPLRVRKPEETRESKRAYVGRPDAATEALRAALVFRASAPQHDEKLLKSGRIDDEELHRWATGDYRIFSERVIESKPDVFMGLLVDLSGSMYGRKLDIAQRLAQLFVWAVHDQPGIETAVWGHTTGEDEYADVYRIWEKGDPLSRLGLIHDLPHNSNADGYAIEYVASQVALAEQPEKVLVVLADGLPAAAGYGGAPAKAHIRSVQRWAASRGVRVIQLAIDPNGIRPEDQAAMFGTDWVGFTDYAHLPRQIATLLGRYI